MPEEKRLLLYTADITPLYDETLYAAAYRLASPARREKTDRYRFLKDKCLSLGAFLLLRHACNTFGFSLENEVITAGDWEKPYFQSGRAEFSLSHSGERVMCALCDLPVGCDVQQEGPAETDIAKRFFHPEEYAALCACGTEEAKKELFYRFWTLKESFIKCIGRGLSQPLDSFAVRPGQAGVRIEQSFDTANYLFFEDAPKDGFRYACCVRLPEGDDDIKAPVPVWKKIDIESLL